MTEPADRSPFAQRDVQQVRAEFNGLLDEAKRVFQLRQVKKAAELLSQAHALANQHSLYSEAARVQTALGILSSGGKPKLLSRGSAMKER